MASPKFGFTNFTIDSIEERENSYEEVVKRLTSHVGKKWICPVTEEGLRIISLNEATVHEFCIWAIQTWPPIKDMLKKKLPEKEELESLFEYICSIHQICKFPKGSMSNSHDS